MKLIIGPRSYSTWSLRPWLILRRCGAEFETHEVDFGTPEGHAEMLRLSPTGLVPVLQVADETIWDSLSIALWAEEHFPQARLWPSHPQARWLARSATCEMHGGFQNLRSALSMNGGHLMVGQSRSETPNHAAALGEIRRLSSLWGDLRRRFGQSGPYLFGDWSIADAFFTPVATRLRHYQVNLADLGDDGTAAAYAATLLQDPDFLEWETMALADIEARSIQRL